jgi:aconitate hydratase
VIAKSFARIHWQNLINFGVLPLTFVDPSDYDRLKQGDKIRIDGIAAALKTGGEVRVEVEGSATSLRLCHTLSERQIDVLLAGGAINWRREHQSFASADSKKGTRS